VNTSIFSTFLNIIRFKGQASDLPYNINFLIISGILSIMTSAALVVSTELIKNPVSYSAAQLVAYCVFYFLILKAHKVSNRIVQSLTAIFGVNTIFQCLTFILALKLGIIIFSLVLTAWNFAVQVFIVKDTLGSTAGKAVFICLGLQIISSIALIFLFPESVDAMRSALQQGAAQ